ncbi:MAG TPA: glycoside hydrolase family 43 protein [Candidatus Didemnitutus sp.]|nr:glycoside hydrolase family 43 protein [Candidatus Didemnitutus sp.]
MSSLPVARPLILQRADPCIRRHDGWYYFTASVPEYDRIELRRSRTIAGLRDAATRDVWRKSATGPTSALIWAPEIHHHFGAWWIYFAAAPSQEIKDALFQHRMYAIGNPSANPLEGSWSPPVRVDSGLDSFSLDATTFAHRGAHYYVWAQKDPAIAGNSNLYIARLATATTLATPPVRLSIPEFDWEIRGFRVNEGPAVLIRHGKVFLSYSASATDENYCLGLLQARDDADLLDPQSWRRSSQPVFRSDFENKVYGPGHNSFTVAEDGSTDLLVFHARTYTEIVGDPLWDPNRHTYVKTLRWDQDGQPVFGKPSEP